MLLEEDGLLGRVPALYLAPVSKLEDIRDFSWDLEALKKTVQVLSQETRIYLTL